MELVRWLCMYSKAYLKSVRQCSQKGVAYQNHIYLTKRASAETVKPQDLTELVIHISLEEQPCYHSYEIYEARIWYFDETQSSLALSNPFLLCKNNSVFSTLNCCSEFN
jgi:hypothetical protein